VGVLPAGVALDDSLAQRPSGSQGSDAPGPPALAVREGGSAGAAFSVVFMGMGDPLANYQRVLAAVHHICDPVRDGFEISQRSVTVSTVGIVPADLPPRRRGPLAEPLHALRRRITR